MTTEWVQILSQGLAVVLVLFAVFKGIPDFLNKTLPKILAQRKEEMDELWKQNAVELERVEARHAREREAQEKRHTYYMDELHNRFKESNIVMRESLLEAKQNSQEMVKELVKTMRELCAPEKK